MSHFNEASHPLIEISISLTVLRRCLLVVPLSILLLLGVIGAAISTLVNGHPVLLTRERLALKHYLDEAQGLIKLTQFQSDQAKLHIFERAPNPF